MMNQLEIFSPSSTPVDIELAEHAAVIRALGKRVVGDVIEIGHRLAICKDRAGHGNWLPWLDREFGWEERTARNFMAVYEMSKTANFADLSIPVSGLYLLAAPSTPPEARAEVIERAEAGEHLTNEQIKEMIDRAAIEKAQTEIAEIQRQADEREAAIRAEYAGKVFIDPQELETEIANRIAGFTTAIETKEAELQKLKEREKARRKKARQQLEKHAEEHIASSKISLQSTTISLSLRELYDAIEITPKQVIDTEMHLGELVGQSKSARLGPMLEHAKTVRTWLDQFVKEMGGKK